MAVKIKLMRMGKIRAPYYRIIVADARTKRDGRAIEEIGKYHPTREPSLIEVDSERAQYWLSVGAQPTEPVAAILKVTGDWQKFKGEPGAEGTLRQPEVKTDKKTLFEAAAKDSSGEAKAGATTPKKRAAKKVAAEAAEGTAASRPTADEAAAEGDPRAAEPADEAATAEAATAEAANAEATPAEETASAQTTPAAEGTESADEATTDEA